MEPKAKRAKRSTPAVTSAEGLSQYEVGTLLGQGAFASVRRATDKSTGKDVAIKEVFREKTGSATAAQEVAVLRSAGVHRHIVSLVANFEDENAFFLVLELVVGGEVFERIASSGPFSEAAAAACMVSILAALEHLHTRHIVHRDLKPENLLYVSDAPNADVKLADFGLAAFCGGPDHPPTVAGEAGTLAYIAPEVFATRQCDAQADVWALGVCLFTLLGGYLPFDPAQNASPHRVRLNVLSGSPAYEKEQGGYPRQWVHVSAEAKRVIGRMLVAEPKRRASACELLSEPWIVGSTTPRKVHTSNMRARNPNAAIHATTRMIVPTPNAPQSRAQTATPILAVSLSSSLCLTPTCTQVLPESDTCLRKFNEARRVWRMAADAISLVVLSPQMSAAAAAAATTSCITPASASASAVGTGGASADTSGTCAASSAASAFVLPESARKELRSAFSKFDEDNSGQIDLDELKHAMRSLGAREADAESTSHTCMHSLHVHTAHRHGTAVHGPGTCFP